LLAEDDSDIQVVKQLINKINPSKFGFSQFKTDGCGRLRNKCDKYVAALFDKGSDMVFVFHDADTDDNDRLRILRRALSEKVLAAKPRGRACIIIPIQEIEAWLLADEEAINSSFSKLTVKPVSNPEQVKSPKEFIERLSRGANSKPRYSNTTHNNKIAAKLNLRKVYEKCPSYRPFHDIIFSL
jgi:hypothetical protein